MFHDDTRSTYLFTATAQGFWQPEQQDLLAGYVPRYFTDVVSLAARSGPALAKAAGSHAFPSSFADPTTVTAARTALTNSTLAPALARALADSTDDLARASRIRTATS
jgi:aminopeptidase N